MRDIKTWLAFGFAGLLIGVCLSVVTAGTLLANRAANQRTALSATGDAVTRAELLASPTLAATPTHTETAAKLGTATIVANRWLVGAEQALKQGQPQRVVDLLMPELERLQGKDRAQAYYFLGLAECQMSHFQLCAAHLYVRQTLDPSAENLMLLGAAYEAAGQYGAAYEMYKQVVEWSGQDAEPFRTAAQRGMDEVNRLCCNKLATPTFDPGAKITGEGFKPTATTSPLIYRQTPVRIDPTDGITKVTMAPGQRQLFSFMPPNVLDSSTVQSLTFHLVAANAQGPTRLELALWRQNNDTWEKVSLRWGANRISTPWLFVTPQWQVFAELYNPDTQSYVVDKVGFTMGVLHAGGNVTVYGLQQP